MRQSWLLRFRKSPAHTQATIVCTVLMMAATIAYAVIAYYQLSSMRGTLAEMKRSGDQSTQQVWKAIDNINWMARSMDWSQKATQHGAEALAEQMNKARIDADKTAQNSLQATLDSLHTQQRAWLSIEAPGRGLVPHAGSIFRVSFPFTNTGFTPAKNLQIFFDGGFFPEGIEPTYEHDGQPQAEGNLSPHGTSYFRYNGERCGPMKIPEHRMFVLYGAITYEDVFRQKHWCTYCFFVKGEEYEYCPKHNDIGDGDLPKGALVPATLPACGGEV